METVWESTLDDIFECRVVRTGERTGQLTVKENVNGQMLLDTAVGLSYGAQFGPDIADIAEWQHQCVNAVDNAKV